MGWVDTHCHLQLDGRNPLELLDRAAAVDWIMVPGIDAASSAAALELASTRPDRLLASVGLHPHDAESFDEQWPRLLELSETAAAIGETGLDYYRNLAHPEAQRRSFQAHIDVARSRRLPLIVHCRDAFADVHMMLEQAELGALAVMHCWTGGPRWTRRFRELGVTFSFAGPVAFETGDTVRRGAAEVPPDRAMVETDTPYLAPPPHRSEPNEPGWVALVGMALAGVWGMDVESVAELTSRKAAAVFGRPQGMS